MDWNTSPYYMQNKHDVSAYIEPTTEHNIPPLLGSSCIEIDSTHPRVSFSYGLKKREEKGRVKKELRLWHPPISHRERTDLLVDAVQFLEIKKRK